MNGLNAHQCILFARCCVHPPPQARVAWLEQQLVAATAAPSALLASASSGPGPALGHAGAYHLTGPAAPQPSSHLDPYSQPYSQPHSQPQYYTSTTFVPYTPTPVSTPTHSVPRPGQVNPAAPHPFASGGLPGPARRVVVNGPGEGFAPPADAVGNGRAMTAGAVSGMGAKGWGVGGASSKVDELERRLLAELSELEGELRRVKGMAAVPQA